MWAYIRKENHCKCSGDKGASHGHWGLPCLLGDLRGRRGELPLEDESRHWDLSLKHPRWSFPAVHWKRVWSSKMPGKAPANCLSLWQSDKCTPNASGEASVNPTSALLFDATAFGESWSHLLIPLIGELHPGWHRERTLRGVLVPALPPIAKGLGWAMPCNRSITRCSILLEHYSFHSYLSGLTVTECSPPGQPNLKPVLSN